MGAGEGEVVFLVTSAMLNGDNVLGLVGDERFVLLIGVAILALVSRPLSYQPSSCCANHDG